MEIVRLKQVLKLASSIILLFAIFFYIIGYKEQIPFYMEVLRYLLMGVYIATIGWTLNKTFTRRTLFFVLFILFLLVSIIIQSCYLDSTHLIFAGVDSWSYVNYAIRYNDLDLWNYWSKLLRSGGFNVDDLGYSTWVYIVAQPFGTNSLAVAYALMLANSVAYIVGVIYFRKLCCILLKDERRVNAATGLWGGFSFLIVTNAVGLKEVLFTTVIIIAVYSIYKYKQRPSIIRFLGSLCCISLTYFFRYALCFALIVSLIVAAITTERNRKTILRLASVAVLITMPILSILLPFVMDTSLEAVIATADARMGSTDASASQRLLFPILTTFFGPFPNVDRTNAYGFMYGFALLLKNLLSPFFLSGVYVIVRRYVHDYFPLLVYIFCNILMLIVSGVTADMRYHITYMPFFFLLLFIPGCRNISRSLYWLYVVAIIAIIFVYTTRAIGEQVEISDPQYIMIN